MQLEGLVIPISFDTGMLLKGVSMITGLIEGAVSATFEWADGMDRLGDVTGMTTEQTAAWAFVAQKAGVEISSLSSAVVIMSKGLVKADGTLDTIGQGFRNWGIDVRDTNGTLKTSAQLMEDAAAKYSSLSTQQERINFLTEVFGKSGANLIDVFDTLAQEGGIDSVTQKVKDFGLAIDPARYEQFQRNLNELKLVATGLGVQFTEALMPALEGVLTWAQQFAGMSPAEIFQRIGEIAGELPEKFAAWAESVDWEKVSADLIAGINSVDWAAVGFALTTNALIILEGLNTIFSGIDWSGLFSGISTAFMDFSTGLVGGDFASFKAVWQSNWQAAAQIVASAMMIAQNSIVNFLKLLPAKISTYFALAIAKLKEAVEKMKEILAELATALGGVSIGTTTATTLTTSKHGKAAGGSASGLTWVGENGPELVNLPTGSYVNNNQSSNRMNSGPTQAYIDYDELARTLARVLGQQMQRAS